MKTHSIVLRVVAIVLLAEIAAAAALSVTIFFHEQRAGRRSLDIALRGRADSLLGAVGDAEDPGDHIFVDPNELRLPPDDRWVVFNADGTLVGHSDNSDNLAELRQLNDGISDQRLARRPFRVLQRHALRIIDRDETGGRGLSRPVLLLYATPRSHLLHEALESASFYILSAVIVSALTAGLIAVVLRVSLRPVAELAAAAERLSLPDLDFTPPASVERITELRPLALTLSAVLENLRAAFAREQRFVGDAAHELKTAVAVVRSTIQVVMLKTRTPEEYHSGLTRALEDTDRLESLVQQMLSLARIEDASPTIIPSPLDLADAVQVALHDLHAIASHARIQISSSLSEGAVIALSPDRARALITNLVLNAIQHSPPEAHVNVSAHRQQQTVILTVQDHGSGIPAEALPHLFERFFRADPSRARETGGTGLGLAICKSIVDHAGGTITVASEPGNGTSVTVTFMAA